MGSEQDHPQIKYRGSQSEGCVVIMVIFTIGAGFISLGPSSLMYFSIVVALGLSAIAIAILHLAKVLQDSGK